MEEKESHQSETMMKTNGSAPSVLPTSTSPSSLGAGGGDQPEMSPTSKEFRESSFATRRKSSQLLSPLRLKKSPEGVDMIDGPEDRIEVEEEGVSLFNVFLEEELEINGIPETAIIESAVTSATIESKKKEAAVNVSAFHFNQQLQATKMSSNGSLTPSLKKYKNPKWAKNGRDLRRLADQFAASREREGVREKARQTVEDADITAAMFWDMLAELFFNGTITWERIIVLFCFCSDVAIFTLKKNAIDYFHRFMVWALQYIRSHVCPWVADNGGWEVVLYFTTDKLMIVTKILVACALAYGAYKLGKSAFESITRR